MKPTKTSWSRTPNTCSVALAKKTMRPIARPVPRRGRYIMRWPADIAALLTARLVRVAVAVAKPKSGFPSVSDFSLLRNA